VVTGSGLYDLQPSGGSVGGFPETCYDFRGPDANGLRAKDNKTCGAERKTRCHH
jgi:hypothetical protein